MKLISWKSPLFAVKWLVCTSLTSNGVFALEIHLVEHHAVAHDKKADPGASSVNKLLSEANPIVETPESRKWIITFDRAVAFKGESESYSFKNEWPKPSEKGRTFVLEESPWIKELGAVLADIEPGCKHYVVATDHLIIEVISANEPKVS